MAASGSASAPAPPSRTREGRAPAAFERTASCLESSFPKASECSIPSARSCRASSHSISGRRFRGRSFASDKGHNAARRQHMVCFCASGGSLRSRKSRARTRPSCSISRTAELSTAGTRKARLGIEEGRRAAPSRTHLETSPIRRLYLGPSSSPSPPRLGRVRRSAWQLPCAARSLRWSIRRAIRFACR
jgi:hypothetical protein